MSADKKRVARKKKVAIVGGGPSRRADRGPRAHRLIAVPACTG